MSAAARAAIAAAATTVAGVSCTPNYRQSTKAGDAMVRLARVAYPDDAIVFGGLVTWDVWIVLPKDAAAAEKWLDEKLPALVTALDVEISIQSAEPRSWQLDQGGQVPILVITGTREQE